MGTCESICLNVKEKNLVYEEEDKVLQSNGQSVNISSNHINQAASKK